MHLFLLCLNIYSPTPPQDYIIPGICVAAGTAVAAYVYLKLPDFQYRLPSIIGGGSVAGLGIGRMIYVSVRGGSRSDKDGGSNDGDGSESGSDGAGYIDPTEAQSTSPGSPASPGSGSSPAPTASPSSAPSPPASNRPTRTPWSPPTGPAPVRTPTARPPVGDPSGEPGREAEGLNLGNINVWGELSELHGEVARGRQDVDIEPNYMPDQVQDYLKDTDGYIRVAYNGLIELNKQFTPFRCDSIPEDTWTPALMQRIKTQIRDCDAAFQSTKDFAGTAEVKQGWAIVTYMHIARLNLQLRQYMCSLFDEPGYKKITIKGLEDIDCRNIAELCAKAEFHIKAQWLLDSKDAVTTTGLPMITAEEPLNLAPLEATLKHWFGGEVIFEEPVAVSAKVSESGLASGHYPYKTGVAPVERYLAVYPLPPSEHDSKHKSEYESMRAKRMKGVSDEFFEGKVDLDWDAEKELIDMQIPDYSQGGWQYKSYNPAACEQIAYDQIVMLNLYISKYRYSLYNCGPEYKRVTIEKTVDQDDGVIMAVSCYEAIREIEDNWKEQKKAGGVNYDVCFLRTTLKHWFGGEVIFEGDKSADVNLSGDGSDMAPQGAPSESSTMSEPPVDQTLPECMNALLGPLAEKLFGLGPRPPDSDDVCSAIEELRRAKWLGELEQIILDPNLTEKDKPIIESLENWSNFFVRVLIFCNEEKIGALVEKGLMKFVIGHAELYFVVLRGWQRKIKTSELSVYAKATKENIPFVGMTQYATMERVLYNLLNLAHRSPLALGDMESKQLAIEGEPLTAHIIKALSECGKGDAARTYRQITDGIGAGREAEEQIGETFRDVRTAANLIKYETNIGKEKQLLYWILHCSEELARFGSPDYRDETFRIALGKMKFDVRTQYLSSNYIERNTSGKDDAELEYTELAVHNKTWEQVRHDWKSKLLERETMIEGPVPQIFLPKSVQDRTDQPS